MSDGNTEIEDGSVLQHMLQEFTGRYRPAEDEKSSDLTLTFEEIIYAISEASVIAEYEKKSIQNWLFIEGYKPVMTKDEGEFGYVYCLKELEHEF